MIEIHLTQEQLVKIILGLQPKGYKECEYFEDLRLGQLYGFPNERWNWNQRNIEILDQPKLIGLFNMLID